MFIASCAGPDSGTSRGLGGPRAEHAAYGPADTLGSRSVMVESAEAGAVVDALRRDFRYHVELPRSAEESQSSDAHVGAGTAGAAPSGRGGVANPSRAPSLASVRSPARSETRTVLKKAVAQDFVADGEVLRPRFAASVKRGKNALGVVMLPSRASGEVHLRDARSGLSLRVRLAGAQQSTAEVNGGYAVYRNALPGGGALVHRPHAEGTEDYLLLQQEPLGAKVDYALGLGDGVAGFRLVEHQLEVLDADGAPRLRVSRPYLVDAKGKRHDARLSMHGCRADEDPRLPWQRPVMDPRSRRCTLRVSWPGAQVAYPALLDPVWSTTATPPAKLQGGSLSWATENSTTLTSTQALVAAEGELLAYERQSDSWAVAPKPGGSPQCGLLPLGRLAKLTDGRVLLRCTGINSVVWLRDPMTAVWSRAADLNQARQGDSVVTLGDGRVLSWSGFYTEASTAKWANAEVYDPLSDSWTATSKNHPGGWGHGGAAVSLADGRLLVMHQGNFSVFSPSNDGWVDLPKPPGDPTASTALVGLQDGRALLVGGYKNPNSAYVFQPSNDSWTAVTGPSVKRANHSVMMLGSGKVLVVGGSTSGVNCNDGPTTKEAELYDPVQDAWTALSPSGEYRVCAGAIRLGTGEVLILGGENAKNSAEVFGIIQGNGSCLVDAECFSGHCADGVCCDAACDGLCEACTAAVKGAGEDGSCGPIVAGSDPQNECLDDGSPSCSNNGYCDGAGACQTYAASTDCTPEACNEDAQCATGFCARRSDTDETGICCDARCDEACKACTAAMKGSGKDGLCDNMAADTDPKDRCKPDPGYPGSCKEDGSCDGSGSCRAFAVAGVSCGEASCSEDASQLSASLCDGGGTCVQSDQACAPYFCENGDTPVCASECSKQDDCVSEHWCSDGTCLPLDELGASCEEAISCRSEKCTDGVCCNASDCAPYRCGSDGTCRESCRSSADCAVGHVCGADGRCKPREPFVVQQPSCSLSVPGTSSRSGWWSLGLALTLLLRHRRRRARRAGQLALALGMTAAGSAGAQAPQSAPPPASPPPKPEAAIAAPRADDTDTAILNKAKELFLKGNALRKSGEYERGLAYFMKSRDLMVSVPNTVNAAICLKQLGRFDEALELLDELLTRLASKLSQEQRTAIEHDVAQLRAAKLKKAKALFAQGNALRKAGDFERALGYFIKSRQLVASVPNTVNAAVCLKNLGRYDEALELFEELLTRFGPKLGESERSAVAVDMAKLRPLVGSVDVMANVKGTLVIDGRQRGTLPLLAPVRLLPGPHLLRVIKEGYRTFQREIKVKKGQTLSVNARLKVLTSAGRLKVDAPNLRGADIFIDGARVGRVPKSGPWQGTLSPGKHLFYVRKSDFGSAPKQIVIVHGQTATADAKLKPLSGTVRIDVTPSSARLLLGDVPLGRGSWSGRLPAEPLRIAVHEDGYHSVRRTIQLKVDREEKTKIALQVDKSHPRWGLRKKGAFIFDAAGAFALSPSLNGDLAEACSSESCAEESLPVGLMATARAGYQFSFGLTIQAAGGYLWLRQQVRRDFAREFSVDTNDGLRSVSLQYDVTTQLRLAGPVAGARVGYRRNLGARWQLDGGVMVGALFASAQAPTTGTVTAADGVLPVGQRNSDTPVDGVDVFVMPEVQLAARFGTFRLGAGLGVGIFFLDGPNFAGQDLALTSGTCDPNNAPTSVGCAPAINDSVGQRAYGPFVLVLPSLFFGYSI